MDLCKGGDCDIIYSEVASREMLWHWFAQVTNKDVAPMFGETVGQTMLCLPDVHDMLVSFATNCVYDVRSSASEGFLDVVISFGACYGTGS